MVLGWDLALVSKKPPDLSVNRALVTLAMDLR